MLVSAFPPNPQGEANYASLYLRALRESAPDWRYTVVSQTTDACTVAHDGFDVERPVVAKGWRRHLSFLHVLRAALRRRPDVIHFQAPLYPDYGGIFGEAMLPALLLLRLFGIRLVVTVHSTWMRADVEELAVAKGLGPLGSRLLVAYYAAVVRSYYALAHGFLILASGETSPAVDRFRAEYGLHGTKVAVEPHPCSRHVVDADETAAARAALGCAPSTPLLLAFGFLRQDKGFHLLVEALGDLQRRGVAAHALIAGKPQRAEDAQYVERLQSSVAMLPDPNACTLWPRFLTDQEMERYLGAADVLVLPYTRSLGASGPGHHALGRGKAVIASDMGQNAGLRGPWRLFASGDARSLADELAELLASPLSLAAAQRRASDYAATHGWRDLAASFHRYLQALRGDARAAFRFAPTGVRGAGEER